MLGSPVKMSSAQRAAKSRPRPDEPACMQHRPPLGRPGHGERAPHLEPLAVVVELVDLVGVGEDRRWPGRARGRRPPRCPTARWSPRGTRRPGRSARRGRGAPSTPKFWASLSFTEVTTFQAARPPERWSSVAKVRATWNGRVVGRRVGGPEADRPGGAGDDAEHDAQVELHRPGPVPHRLGHRPAVDAGHGQAVVEEHHVEAALFEGPAELLVVARREEAVLGGRMAPRAGVDRGVAGLHEPHQRHLPLRCCTHGVPLAVGAPLKHRM